MSSAASPSLDDDPAIRAASIIPDTGFAGTSVYGGVWGSNVDFSDGDGAHVELDWTFGIGGEILDSGVNYTLGGIYYSILAKRIQLLGSCSRAHHAPLDC